MVITRIQKEKRVIELHEQEKNIREIAKEVHMAFGTNRLNNKKNTEDKDKKKTFLKDTQAIKLYQGKDASGRGG